MKITLAACVLLLAASPAIADDIYIDTTTGTYVAVPQTNTVVVGGVGSVGSAFPNAGASVVVHGGAGSVGSVYQPFNPNVVTIGEQ